MSDSSTNQPFKADDQIFDPEINLSGSLDLSGCSAGNYYYNSENNYEYTKNWFNYNKFDTINEETIISEVVQYASPPLVPGTLDTSKTYVLPSTSLTASWAARVETGSNFITPGYSGLDSLGNTYVLANYSDPNNAVVYNADNTVAFTLLPNGAGSTSTCLTKFNSVGVALWSVRIRHSVAGNTTLAFNCATDNNGVTYILGSGGNNILFEQTVGAPVAIPCSVKDYLTAYSPSGTWLWTTYFTEGFLGGVFVDNQTIGNVYVYTSLFFTPLIFYDGVPAAPTPVLALGRGPTKAFGTSQITHVSRDALGNATIQLSTLAESLGIFNNQYIALLGITNDGGTFITPNPVQITVTNFVTYSTLTYVNNVGTIPFATALVTGEPVLSVGPCTNAVAQFRSSSGLFQWAATYGGFGLGESRNFTNYLNRSQASDLYGNIYLTGYYTSFEYISDGATTNNPVVVDSGKSLPPFSSPVVWNPVEENRDWSSVAVNNNGSVIVATVNFGYIYVSTDTGTTWTQRATLQKWSSVFCNDTGSIMVATISDSVIERSVDGGVNWTITGGTGATASNWIAIDGKADGSVLVALDQNGKIHYSSNFGLSWTVSTSITANWIDVAYDSSTVFGPLGSFTAVIAGGAAYRSIDDGVTWVLDAASPVADWSAITGTNDGPYKYYATVNNGALYGVNDVGNWVVLNSTGRKWTDIAANSDFAYAAAFNDAIYQSISSIAETWIPTTIPRNWNRITLSKSIADPTSGIGVATVKGGQIYVAKESFPQRNAYLLKYSPSGQVVWTNFIDTKNPEGASTGSSIVCQSNGNVILSGRSNRFDMYSTSDFNTPVKSIDNPSASLFVAAYSNDGIPLWVSMSTLFGEYASLSVDNLDNIYCFAYGQGIQLYQPSGQLCFSQVFNLFSEGLLVKYYPNGFVQSFTRIANVAPQNVYGTSVSVLNSGDVYLSGWNETPIAVLNFYDSPGNVGGVTESFTNPGVFVGKYTSNSTMSFVISGPAYNTTFDTRLSIGGSSRKLIGGFQGDGAIELWGSQTGLPPSAITLTDANAAVISYLGQEPGYSIPIVNGLQEFNPNVYRVLTVGLSEPTFPTNDPQPVSSGTIPYGYLPFFMEFPGYTTGLTFNNTLNNNSELILSATGIIPASGLAVSGVSAGDVIRILVTNATTSCYVTLTVKGFVLSDVLFGVQTGLAFEENTRFLALRFGSTANATVQLITIGSAKYASAFVQPALIDQGTLKLILQLYPKSTF